MHRILSFTLNSFHFFPGDSKKHIIELIIQAMKLSTYVSVSIWLEPIDINKISLHSISFRSNNMFICYAIYIAFKMPKHWKKKRQQFNPSINQSQVTSACHVSLINIHFVSLVLFLFDFQFPLKQILRIKISTLSCTMHTACDSFWTIQY